MKSNILLTTVIVFITLNAIAQSPNEQLQELVGTWVVIESSYTDPPEGIVTVSSVADGHAVYSTWKQGSAETYYEANALWGYSETTKQVIVFEVNTLGVADTHVGYFDDSGALIAELRDHETNDLLQQRIMTWTSDTWKMTALFIVDGREVKHYATLVRQDQKETL